MAAGTWDAFDRATASRARDHDQPWVCDLPTCDGMPHATFTWRHARTAQRPPAGDDWQIHLVVAGRGFGKSRQGAETLVQWMLDNPKAADGSPTQWAIVAETFGDVRMVCVEGDSGLIRVLNRRHIAHTYNRSLWQIRLASGPVVHMLGADNADVGRGLNLSGLWADEVCKWRYLRASWSEGLAPALRIGKPHAIVTTTPKPSAFLREWMSRNDGSVVVTRGSTFENAANLSDLALTSFRRWEGTRLGRQELMGELLDDVPGALWQRAQIDADRRSPDQVPDLVRVVVGVDPATTSGEDSDLTGIVAAGKDRAGQFWVLADRSCRATPDGWARVVADLFHEVQADVVVAETNNGGEMVTAVIRHADRSVPVRMVTATRGKRLRAEPISLLYERHQVHHAGPFPDLEDELVSWTPESTSSPDRLDAAVWSLTELSGRSTLREFLEAAEAERLGQPPRPPAPPRDDIHPALRRAEGPGVDLAGWGSGSAQGWRRPLGWQNDPAYKEYWP